MKTFKEFINESNIDKIKEECKRINPYIDYLSSDWEEEFIKKINWNYISWNQKLSEDFIEYFKDNVSWKNISLYQKLSKKFIEKHKDKIDFEILFDNKNLTNEFIFNNINWFINKDVEYYSWRFDNKEFNDKWNKYKKLFGS